MIHSTRTYTALDGECPSLIGATIYGCHVYNTMKNNKEDADGGRSAGEEASSCSFTATTPFEWLTSPESLRPHILAALQQQQQQPSSSTTDDEDHEAAAASGRRILHVGCGSSILGEILVTQTSVYRNVQQVVNVDKDAETLRHMQERWQAIAKNSSNQHDDDDDRMIFECIDFTCERLQAWDSASFDLVLDKSTLDCLLCTDKAAAGLLTEVYRVLKPGGVYLLVSFHEAAFLRPLLADLPGADWIVSDCVMQRQVEDLIGAGSSSRTNSGSSTKSGTNVITSVQPPLTSPPLQSEAEEAAVIKINSDYRRTVNVFQCRKRQESNNAAASSNNQHHHHHAEHQELDWNAVYHHVHDTNDQWFREQNPMLSEERKQQIQETFGVESLALADAYSVLFTDAEREHLEYEGFLEDWQAFCKSHDSTVEGNRMAADDAIAFLDEMQ